MKSNEPQTTSLNWLEGLLDAALVVNDHGTITQVNASTEALFGYTRAELIGKPMEMLIPERLRDGHARLRAVFFAEPHPRPMGKGLELYARRKDGIEFLAAISIGLIGTVPETLAMAIVRDITERKRIERVLQRRVTDLSVLNSMATIVTESMDEDEILNRVMNEALHLVGVEVAATLLLDKEAGEMVMVAHRGLSDEFTHVFGRVKVGEGVCGMVAQTGEPLIINGLAEYPEALRAHLEKERIQSTASVPLVGRAGVVGVMILAASTPDCFDSAGMKLLITLAQQVAFGVEQARLHAETRRQNRHLSVLYAVSRAVFQSLNLEETLNSAIMASLEVLDAEKGGIYLLDGDGKSLVLHAHSGYSDRAIRLIKRLKSGEGISGMAIAQKQPVVLDSSEYPTEHFASYIKKQVKTLVSVPLWSAGQVVGAFTLGTKRPNAFPPEELDLLTAIAQQLGNAVQNARLYQAVQKELTERRQTEKALRESEEKFRALSEQSLLAMGFIQDGEVKYANKAYSDISGYSIDDIMSWTWKDFAGTIHPDDREFVMEQIRKKQSGDPGTLVQYQFKGISKSGELKWIEVYSKTVLYQGKNANFVMFIDISERKHTEEALQRYTQRLMILHEIDRYIAMARSPKNIADTVLEHIRKLISCWRACVNLYEPDTDEFVVLSCKADGESMIKPGMRFSAPTGWAERVLAQRYKIIDDTRSIPEPYEPLIRLVVTDGTRSVLSTSLLVEGNLVGALILGSKTPSAFTAEDIEIAREVTDQLAVAIYQAGLREEIERYSAELEKRVAQRTAQLETANKDLESFSYSVSHDLRAPLRAISGFASIVARRYHAVLNDEGRHYVDNIVLASKRMGQLIDDLLQYARLGRSSVRCERVPLGEVFESLSSDLAASLAEINGTLCIADDLPEIMGDKTLISQVFANLLENAITYRQPGLPVQVTVSCQTENKDIIVCVGDNGIGISAEYHEKIFNVFQRLHSDDEYPGTGIGLATVNKSVGLLGGRVWVESDVGGGSKFFVKLPKGE